MNCTVDKTTLVTLKPLKKDPSGVVCTYAI